MKLRGLVSPKFVGQSERQEGQAEGGAAVLRKNSFSSGKPVFVLKAYS